MSKIYRMWQIMVKFRLQSLSIMATCVRLTAQLRTLAAITRNWSIFTQLTAMALVSSLDITCLAIRPSRPRLTVRSAVRRSWIQTITTSMCVFTPGNVHIVVLSVTGGLYQPTVWSHTWVLTMVSICSVVTGLHLIMHRTNGLYWTIIIRSTCNSPDTLLAEALIYRLRGHYVGLRRKSGPIRYIRADIVTLWAISALI